MTAAVILLAAYGAALTVAVLAFRRRDAADRARKDRIRRMIERTYR